MPYKKPIYSWQVILPVFGPGPSTKAGQRYSN